MDDITISAALPPVVVYVCRKQSDEAGESFTRFINSYKKHPAGCEHLLKYLQNE
jgi:hypothetical protein